MYTLYYINQLFQINTIEVQSLDIPLIIPEDLHFIALRKGINFINEPSECLAFTDLERLAISGRLDEITIFANHSFRKANTTFTALCQVDQNGIDPQPNNSPFWTLQSYDIQQSEVLVKLQSDIDFTDLQYIYFKGNLNLFPIDIDLRSNRYPISDINTIQNTVAFYVPVEYFISDYYFIMHEQGLVRSDNIIIDLEQQQGSNIFNISDLTRNTSIFDISSNVNKNQVFRFVEKNNNTILNSNFFRLDNIAFITVNGYDTYQLTLPYQISDYSNVTIEQNGILMSNVFYFPM